MPIEPQLSELMKATESPRLELLFDAESTARVIAIRDRAHQLWTITALEKSLPAGPKQAEQTARRLELVGWMEAQRAEFKEWLLGKYPLRRSRG